MVLPGRPGEPVQVLPTERTYTRPGPAADPTEGTLFKYKCYKEVHAAKISIVSIPLADGRRSLTFTGTNGNPGNVIVSAEYFEKHNPVANGYYVRYADGYESFSPAEAFESGYALPGEVNQFIHIQLQDGPIQENGINGCQIDAVIEWCRDKIISFNTKYTKFSCRENAMAITKLDEAMMWLQRRTEDRIKRNVEGTSAA